MVLYHINGICPIFWTVGAGLFSFKNYQLMSVTDSLFRRSGRAVAKLDMN